MPKAKKTPVTILDVARYAGVSTSTVSRTLTGNVAVTPEKKEIIMAAIEALGYHPNPTARQLANITSMLIGILTHRTTTPRVASTLRTTSTENRWHNGV